MVLLALAWAHRPAPAAQAQTSGANLIGQVTDKNGGALPGVTVTATNKDTGLTRIAVTSADGTFRLPSLPVGIYTVTAELSGFATVTSRNVRLNVATERDDRTSR